jgi:hypothetical protein
VKWVSVAYGYLGYIYKSPNPTLLMFAYVLAAFQGSVSPLRIRRPSQAIYWILYFTVYIPGLFVPLFMGLDSGYTLFLLQLSLTVAMTAIAFSYRISMINFRNITLNPKLFLMLLITLFLVGNAVLITAGRGHLKLASYADVYKVRFQSKQMVEQDPLVGYVSLLLANVVNPVLIAIGLATRRKSLVVLGFLGEIINYSVTAQKEVIAGSVLIICLYYTIRRDQESWIPKIGLFFATMLLVLTTYAIDTKPGIVFNAASLILMRTFATPGMAIGQYNYFFENRPHTHLANVKGFSIFSSNPYKLPLGQEMSSYYWVGLDQGNGQENENASPFAMDGIAGFGLPGIPIIGVALALVFWLVDSCAGGYPIEVSVSALTMMIFTLSNVSLFTTLLGQGLMAWMVVFLFMPRRLLDIRASP